MKSLFFASVFVISISAHARIFEKETEGECVIASMTKTESSFPEIVHQTRIPFRFPATATEMIETVDGVKFVRFGVGKVVLNQAVEMLDADGSLVMRPFKITMEITHPSKMKKHLRAVAEVSNVFTGELDTLIQELPPEHDPDFDGSFLYVEQAITAPNHKDLPIGALVQTGLICPFSPMIVID